MKCYSYIRFSTRMQGRENKASFKRQLEQAEAYAKENGWEIDKTKKFHDLGVSAYKGKNKDIGMLSKFLEMVEHKVIKKGSILLIESLDRLTRQNLLEAQNLFNSIINAGIRIVTLIDRTEYDKETIINNPYMLIQAAMVFIRANEESRTKSVRLLDAWNRKRKRLHEEGRFFTKILPEWLTYKDTTIIPIPDRVQLINRIFLLAKNGYGKAKICRILNQEGTPAFRGGLWATSSLQRLLRNRAVIGMYQPYRKIDGKRVKEGEEIGGYLPAIVDENLFYYVQSKYENQPIQGGGGKNVNNLFTGLVKCGFCGSSMFYVNKGKWKYLVCSAAKGGGNCDYRSIPYGVFENSFFEFYKIDFNKIFSSKTEVDTLNQVSTLIENVDALSFKFKENKKKIQGIMKKFATVSTFQENAMEVIEELSKENDEITEKLKSMKSEINQKKSYVNVVRDQLQTMQSYREKLNELQADQEKVYAFKCRIRENIREMVSEISFTLPSYTIHFRNGNEIEIEVDKFGDSTIEGYSQVLK